MVTATQLIDAFDSCFLSTFRTKLVGGADEPLYVPQLDDGIPAYLYFRLDYPSSALHEISHWCLAGEERRKLEDYGYWYETDSRSEEQQKLFEQVEVKPQAIECFLHWAAGMEFKVSVDNLSLPEYDATPFKGSVMGQVYDYLKSRTLPPRAYLFAQFLLDQRLPNSNFYEYMTTRYENHC